MNDINETKHDETWNKKEFGWQKLPQYIEELDNLDVMAMLTSEHLDKEYEARGIENDKERKQQMFTLACEIGRWLVEHPEKYKDMLAGEIIASMKIASARMIQMAVYEIEQEQKEEAK